MAFKATTARVLLTSVGQRPDSNVQLSKGLDSETCEELPRAAHFHGIGAYVYEMLNERSGLDDDLIRQLRGLRNRNSFAHLRSLLDLRFLEGALSSDAIPWLIIKGPTLSAPVHGAAHLRGYSDLDALVAARDLKRALDALTSAGATVRDQNWTLIRQEMKGEVHVVLPSGTHLDLHWHLSNEPERRRAFPIDIDALFERSVMVDVDGASVRTLGPVDNTVYIALHTIHSGGHRLIWLKDFEGLLAQEGLDPREIAQRAAEWNSCLVLRAALLRTESTLGPLPLAEPLRELLPTARTWETVASRAWRSAPAAQEDGTGSIGRVVARSVRTNQARTFSNLIGRTLRHMREGRHRNSDIEGPRHFSPDDPRSDRFPAGGEAAMQAYLRAVAAEDPPDKVSR